MPHKETSALWRWLRSRGWSLVSQKNHLVWEHPNGRKLSTSGTPKCPQDAAKNARKDAKRLERLKPGKPAPR